MMPHLACRQNGSRRECYTTADLADMHLAYGSSGCNGRITQKLHVQHYLRRQTPCQAFFARLHQRLSAADLSFFVHRNVSKESEPQTT
ncbi:hypothetical protein TNCV_280191 [Trichonephila clavipes]|nr:hypothetical protein TNCV_280191 [Trichonephila clavipes]